MDLANLLNGYLKNDQVIKIQAVKSNDEIQIYMIETKNLKKYFAKATMNELSSNRKKKEIQACKAIKNTLPDFPCVIPRIIKYSQNFTIYLEDAIEGNQIINFIDNNQIVFSIFKDLAGVLLDMHSVEISHCTASMICDNTANWHDYVNNSVFRYVQQIIQDNIIPNRTLNALIMYWNKHEAILDNIEKFCLVHNDLNGENILFNNQKGICDVSGIIDFERCIVGDPVKDISKLIWLFRKNPYAGDIFIKEYFKGQKHMEEILIKIRLYFIWDILNHLQQQKYLLQFTQWKLYLDEEKMILNNTLLKEECKLW